MNEIIRGFWTGPPLSDLHRACLRSFLSHGHRFIIYTYDPLVVPEGVMLEDAARIVPREEMFYFDNPITGMPDVAPFADYFRLRLLYETGGWYCDIDTVCLSSRLPMGRRVWARQCPELNPDSVSNGQLFFEKGDPLLLELIRRCERLRLNIQRREALGPLMISGALKELNLPRDMGATAEMFYPIRWIEVFKLWLPEFRQAVEDRMKRAIFVPIYQSFPLYIGLDRRKLPPKGSYLSGLIERLVPDADGPSHDAREVREATDRWFRANEPWASEWLEAAGAMNG